MSSTGSCSNERTNRHSNSVRQNNLGAALNTELKRGVVVQHPVAKYLRHGRRRVNEVPILPRFVDESAAPADRNGGRHPPMRYASGGSNAFGVGCPDRV
jgi:hypothetical protein